MEWKKVQKTDHTFPKRHSIKKSAKEKSEYINSMTRDSTSSSSCILYLLIRTSKDIFQKNVFWSSVNV